MPISAIFCLFGRSNVLSAGMGRIRIARSVVMCMLAFENHSPFMLRQYPGVSGAQNLDTGMQLRNALTTAHVPYEASTKSIAQQAMRILFVGKTRKYCSRIEALAQMTAAL